jgi:hypothetical protein
MSGIGASRRPWDIRVRGIFGLQLPLSCLMYFLQIRRKLLCFVQSVDTDQRQERVGVAAKKIGGQFSKWLAVYNVRPSAVRIQEQPSALWCVTCLTCPGGPENVKNWAWQGLLSTKLK